MNRIAPISRLGFCLVLCGTSLGLSITAAPIEWTILDGDSGLPMPCRIHLKDASGKAVQPEGLPFWRDHFVCACQARLELGSGRYTYEVERGPEYYRTRGALEVEDGAEDHAPVVVTLKRLVDLTREGWWSGETHVHRPVSDLALLMRAEDLHVAQAITWWNDSNLWKGKSMPPDPLLVFDQNRYCQIMAGEDERGGGALLYFNLREPLEIAGARREYPAAVSFLEMARMKHGRAVWVDIEKPFWWDVPIWLASGEVDSIGLAHNHMHRGGVLGNEAWGRGRDQGQYPGSQGNGLWTQDIYYHVLNSGLRIPPTAGSASGVLPNPVGHNRVYVWTGAKLTYDSWWEGVRAGRVFVSNGPLLRVQANDQWPGHVFRIPAGQALHVSLTGSLDAADDLARVEVIRDGKIVREVEPAHLKRGAAFASLTFERSGWFLVRAFADVPGAFRFASTGPFYVETDHQPRRVHRESAQFFLEWLRQRRERLDLDDAAQRQAVMDTLAEAEQFWSRKVQEAGDN